MKLSETRIRIGGVFRCCLSTIGHEFGIEENIRAGAETRCKHCNQLFILHEPKEVGSPAYWKQVQE